MVGSQATSRRAVQKHRAGGSPFPPATPPAFRPARPGAVPVRGDAAAAPQTDSPTRLADFPASPLRSSTPKVRPATPPGLPAVRLNHPATPAARPAVPELHSTTTENPPATPADRSTARQNHSTAPENHPTAPKPGEFCRFRHFQNPGLGRARLLPSRPSALDSKAPQERRPTGIRTTEEARSCPLSAPFDRPTLNPEVSSKPCRSRRKEACFLNTPKPPHVGSYSFEITVPV